MAKRLSKKHEALTDILEMAEKESFIPSVGIGNYEELCVTLSDIRKFVNKVWGD